MCIRDRYGTVVLNGIEYYRTRVEDSDGNRVALYAKTPEKLYDKELELSLIHI